ncbi:transcriptional regulator [Edwardsiella ictaluri]|uniref:hypothetical protein n=1 Tax=Edwardsiella anguillarum TaxID=1821960 RepID=UPI0008FB6D08|nr:transcriptional regulator [Edwardsiella ictaluri]
MATLDSLLTQCSPESRAKIEVRVDELRREVLLHQLREELSTPQSESASVPAVKIDNSDKR